MLEDRKGRYSPKAARIYNNPAFKQGMNVNYETIDAIRESVIFLQMVAKRQGLHFWQVSRYGQYQKILTPDPTKWGTEAGTAYTQWDRHVGEAIFSLGLQANSDQISRIHPDKPPSRLALLQACLDICFGRGDYKNAVPMYIDVSDQTSAKAPTDDHVVEINWEYDDDVKPTAVTRLKWTMVCPTIDKPDPK